MQRWPAVPTAEKTVALHSEIRLGRTANDHRVVAAELEDRSPEACGDGLAHDPSHRGRPGGAYNRHPVVADQCRTDRAVAENQRAEPPARAVARELRFDLPYDPIEDRVTGEGAQRCLLRGLPDHRVAADECQRRVPSPDRDREVERRDDARPVPIGCHCSISRCPGLSLVIVAP